MAIHLTVAASRATSLLARRIIGAIRIADGKGKVASRAWWIWIVGLGCQIPFPLSLIYITARAARCSRIVESSSSPAADTKLSGSRLQAVGRVPECGLSVSPEISRVLDKYKRSSP